VKRKVWSALFVSLLVCGVVGASNIDDLVEDGLTPYERTFWGMGKSSTLALDRDLPVFEEMAISYGDKYPELVRVVEEKKKQLAERAAESSKSGKYDPRGEDRVGDSRNMHPFVRDVVWPLAAELEEKRVAFLKQKEKAKGLQAGSLPRSPLDLKPRYIAAGGIIVALAVLGIGLWQGLDKKSALRRAIAQRKQRRAALKTQQN